MRNDEVIRDMILKAIEKSDHKLYLLMRNELAEKIKNMISIHEDMKSKYFVSDFTFSKEKPEEYVKNRSKEVEFKFDNDLIKIKQTCYIANTNILFKTKYYINNKLVKKNINWVKNMLEDIYYDDEIEVEYPVKPKLEEPIDTKNEEKQLSLFDLMMN